MWSSFEDRAEAGRQLAAALAHHANEPDLLVLALPRGGVPVAFEVAQALNAPLDVFLVRKLGTPQQRELAMGAVASGGLRVLNERVINALGISPLLIDRVVAEELREIERRERAYRPGLEPLRLQDRTVLVIDDGVATGSTIKAALETIRLQHPRRLIAAVPVGAQETIEELERYADEVVCLQMPEPFLAIGIWYEKFPQLTDEEVCALLQRAAARKTADTTS
jgi:putative phosphoribosyl transferase